MEHLKRVYCKAVDPNLVSEASKAGQDDYKISEVEEPSWENPGNLIVSGPPFTVPQEHHTPLLDIDIPVELIESSTPGHHHLGFPEIKLSWTKYVNLLKALKDAGIIEPGYYGASIERGFTAVRTPDNRKPEASDPIGFIQIYNEHGDIVDKPIYAPKPDPTPDEPLIDTATGLHYNTTPKHIGIAATAAENKVLRYMEMAGRITTLAAVAEHHFHNNQTGYRIPGAWIPPHKPAEWDDVLKYGPGGKLQKYAPNAYQWYTQHNISGIEYTDFLTEQHLYRVTNKNKETFYHVNK